MKTKCRITNDKLIPFLDLGKQPLANGFLNTKSRKKKEYFYNLKVGFSNDNAKINIEDDSKNVSAAGIDSVDSFSQSLETLDDLFTIAEIYRDDIGLADSSIAYYEEIINRYPTSEQLPRALYSIAWILDQLNRDLIGAEFFWKELI